MDVVWDPEKARSNLKKHRIRFADAETVLFDLNALTREDIESEGDQRFVTVGMDTLGNVLVVVNTYRGEDIRMIKVRFAIKRERMQYEQGL